jgi:hypothetical protein
MPLRSPGQQFIPAGDGEQFDSQFGDLIGLVD